MSNRDRDREAVEGIRRAIVSLLNVTDRTMLDDAAFRSLEAAEQAVNRSDIPEAIRLLKLARSALLEQTS